MNAYCKYQIRRNDRKTLKYSKVPEFMAGNGLRQLGEPRTGEFANRQRPEPVHNEINAWRLNVNPKPRSSRDKC